MRLPWTARLTLAGALCLVWGCSSSTPAPNPTPQITGLFPSEITAGSQAFTLFVSGVQFLSTSTVQWNGSDRPTVFNQASTQLAVSITAADVQNAGLGEVTVTSPAPGGGTSLAVSFTINPAHAGAPSITSLSPSTAALNGQAFTLMVNGTNFSPSDYVTWNGGLRTTCPEGSTCSPTQLSAEILASDLTQQMVASVAVHTSQLGIASPSVSFQVGNPPSSNARFPHVISINATGGPANGLSSSPAISADGRYVAFYSEAKNLVSGRTPGGAIASGTSGDIFVRDTCLGATGCVPRTVAVDVGPGGQPPNASAAEELAISADGRYVAFASSATNLVPNTAGSQPVRRVFVRDVCTGRSAAAGCLPQTELVSANADGETIGGGQPSISADGRFVAFTVPVSAGKPSSLVMVRDTCHGRTAAATCVPRTRRISASADDAGLIYVDRDAHAAISSSGRYVAFASSMLGAEHSQIFLRDTCLGVRMSESCAPSTARVSVAPDGQIANASSRLPSISADGRFLVFQSAASNLADISAGGQQIYLRDTCAGPTAPFGCTPLTTRVSSGDTLVGDAAGSYSPSISSSGRYISYTVQTVAQEAATGTRGYIVVYDTCFGETGPCSPHAAVLPVASPLGGKAPLIGDIRVRVPIANDGRFAAFFTQVVLPELRSSGFGDVFLTTTPFQTH
jgi:trimeric autotransporter adhesin